MHIVIMGCGRVGSTLAHILEDQGHSVSIIDQNPEAFRRLRSGFRGRRITGFGFDRDVIAEAGIEHGHEMTIEHAERIARGLGRTLRLRTTTYGSAS